jgi:hypothetical protein
MVLNASLGRATLSETMAPPLAIMEDMWGTNRDGKGIEVISTVLEINQGLA